MATRAKSRSKSNFFPVIQDELTPLFETYSTDGCFEDLSNTPCILQAVARNLKEITKHTVSGYERTVTPLTPALETTRGQDRRGGDSRGKAPETS